MPTRKLALSVLVSSLLASTAAFAEDSARAPEAQPPKPQPYSLPWSLRPAIAASVLRVDSALAFQDNATTAASTLLGSYKIAPDVALLARIALVHNAPDHSASGTAISNPLLGATFTPELTKGLRLPLFLGFSIPAGSGGGNPDNTLAGANGKVAPPGGYAVEGSGIYARGAMDNALFAINFGGFIVGAGIAYMTHGLTLQGEATVLRFIRARGGLYEVDDARTNFTAGAHVGYTILKPLTVSAELRYQRWLSTPAAVKADDRKRDEMTVGLGVRTRIDLFSDKIVMRPGLAYFHPVVDPMTSQGYRVVILDIPFSF